jgi:SAM-dependent methyltransferase
MKCYRVIKKYVFFAIRNARYLSHSRFRRCRCCLKPSFFVSLSEGEEFKICIRCRANLRYEMLAGYVREHCPDLGNKEVMELAPRSPLNALLSNAKKYIRTYYSEDCATGRAREDGAICEDITRLSLGDSSMDIIISSDVLEHVEDLEKAFRETARVLRTGGYHLFTVPMAQATRKRASGKGASLAHYCAPEVHFDPMDPEGILCFWDIGPDIAERFRTDNLAITIVAGPIGRDGRYVLKATKKGES